MVIPRALNKTTHRTLIKLNDYAKYALISLSFGQIAKTGSDMGQTRNGYDLCRQRPD